MAKIIVGIPCQTIHRFLLPPHSKHVMSHQFPGGGVVLAETLHQLVVPDGSSSASNKLAKWKKNSRDKDLPHRFFRMAPFAATPALAKHLKPETQFLRVEEVEDGDGFYKEVQTTFRIALGSLERNVFVVGGDEAVKTWRSMAKPIDTTGEPTDNSIDLEAGDVVYIFAKTYEQLEKHLDEFDKKETKDGVHVVAQIDVSSLAATFPVQTETSYERTVGDICRATRPKDGKSGIEQTMLEDLFKKRGLDHLIVRIGNAACLLVSRNASTGGKKLASKAKAPAQALPPQSPPAENATDEPNFHVRLFCHPDRCAPTTFPGLGYMLAYDMLLCAGVVYQIATAPSDEKVEVELNKGDKLEMPCLHAAVLEGARIGVQATYRCFSEGFGIFDRKADDAKKDMVKVPPEVFFANFIRHGIKAQTNAKGGKASVLSYPPKDSSKSASTTAPATAAPAAPQSLVHEPPPDKMMGFDVHYDTARSPNKFWRMVVPDERGSEADPCLDKARGHLMEDKKLPVVELGKHKLVDRQEVEDYLYLQRLLLSYHADPEWRRPLCIGVFGQPGAGKSFGVKQLVSEMASNSGAFSKDSTEVNLSQLRSLEQLMEYFHQVRDKCLLPPIPLVFFDEFDSSFEDRTFGWLKYFLAPMQDGTFLEKGKEYHFGKAIFVFAGGVNHSFAEFNERTRNPSFCDAKGPDFISRLRGILNISSMNQPEGETVEHLYRIRRAVFLRWILEEKVGKAYNKDGTIKKLIDDMLADAFLTIPRYKHGARSLQAILEMSTFVRGQTFTHSNLPPRDQLDMHVDAREFLRLAGVHTTLSKC